MKRKLAGKKAAPVIAKLDGLPTLIAEVRELIRSARQGVVSAVDTFQVMTNFEIGRRIVEHEQKGAKRAAYGTELLKELSARLTEEFGRGFSEDNLTLMRKFYLLFHDRIQISEAVSRKLTSHEKSQTLSGKFAPAQISETMSRKSVNPFTLSWSHYVMLLSIKDPDERSFYEIEAASENWSLREIKRQVASGLYERLALSRDKKGIRKLAAEGQIISKPEDVLKEPYTLEFLGLAERTIYSESDLEQAIIDRKDAIVELTLPKDANIHAREYKLYLSSKELLRKKLREWTRDQEVNA